MMQTLRLLAVFYRTSVQTDMEYRADFFTRLVASLLGLLTTIGGLSIAFQYTAQIKGWSFPQVLVLLAVYYLMDGLIEMFIAPNMREIMVKVREGTLDFVLLKPVSSQFMATFRTINVWRAANLLVGAGLLVYTMRRLALVVGAQQAGAFALTLVAGVGVVYSFWLVLVTLTFWFVRIENIEQIVWQAFEAGRYPVEIYPGWLRATLTYVVPVAFIITVPARALAGRLDPGFVAVSLAVALGSLVLSSLFWRFGLRYYTGASA
jgi:ABC-2 type transport system permease protein